jgi:hypothetical protein
MSREACFGAICFYALGKSYCWRRRGVIKNLPIWAAITLCGLLGLRAVRIAPIEEGSIGDGEVPSNDREIDGLASINGRNGR